jgi:hypothetical protein
MQVTHLKYTSKVSDSSYSPHAYSQNIALETLHSEKIYIFVLCETQKISILCPSGNNIEIEIC